MFLALGLPRPPHRGLFLSDPDQHHPPVAAIASRPPRSAGGRSAPCSRPWRTGAPGYRWPWPWVAEPSDVRVEVRPADEAERFDLGGLAGWAAIPPHIDRALTRNRFLLPETAPGPASTSRRTCSTWSATAAATSPSVAPTCSTNASLTAAWRSRTSIPAPRRISGPAGAAQSILLDHQPRAGFGRTPHVAAVLDPHHLVVHRVGPDPFGVFHFRRPLSARVIS